MMIKRSMPRWSSLILPVIVLMLVACQPIQPVSESAAAPASAASSTVMVSSNEPLGDFLADSQGNTLYLFLKDEPGVSNCYDQCAENWPPLLADGDLMGGEGIDASLLGTTERTDGAMQVTYNGWPLYYYVQDVTPGDTVGQEKGDVWYVISPAGEQVGGMVAEALTVMVSSNEPLGDFLADSQGNTLYLFLKDEPGVSNCYDQCAENWPPLLADGDLMGGEGIDASLLGTTERTDGAMQVTYNGWPLYYYVQDVTPGDTVGQEKGDVWYVISPAGEQVQ